MHDSVNRRGILERLLQKPTRTLSFVFGWAGGAWATRVELVPANHQILLWTFYAAAGLACAWVTAWWLVHGRGR